MEDLDIIQPLDNSNFKQQKDVCLKWFNEQYIALMEENIKYQMDKH